MREIQDKIPAEELSVQIDLAVDTAFWEGAYDKPWFDGDVRERTLRYILRMIEQVDEGGCIIAMVSFGLVSGPPYLLLLPVDRIFCSQDHRRHGAQTLDGARIPPRRG